MSGVILSYHLPANAKDLKFEFTDPEGRMFHVLSGASTRAGFNRTSVFLQYPSFRSVPGMIMWAAGPRPIVDRWCFRLVSASCSQCSAR